MPNRTPVALALGIAAGLIVIAAALVALDAPDLAIAALGIGSSGCVLAATGGRRSKACPRIAASASGPTPTASRPSAARGG